MTLVMESYFHSQPFLPRRDPFITVHQQATIELNSASCLTLKLFTGFIVGPDDDGDLLARRKKSSEMSGSSVCFVFCTVEGVVAPGDHRGAAGRRRRQKGACFLSDRRKRCCLFSAAEINLEEKREGGGQRLAPQCRSSNEEAEERRERGRRRKSSAENPRGGFRDSLMDGKDLE